MLDWCGANIVAELYRCIGHIYIGMYVHQWGRWGVCRRLGGKGFSGLLLLRLILESWDTSGRRRRCARRVLHWGIVCHFQSIISDVTISASGFTNGSGPWR